MAVLLDGTRHMHCPNCGLKVDVRDPRAHPFHACPKLAGIQAPLVLDGVAAKVVAVEREDYVGHEDVQLDGNGRPIMAVVTTRDDGQDVAVFAPVAHARAQAQELQHG